MFKKINPLKSSLVYTSLVVFVIFGLVLGSFYFPKAKALTINEQINALQKENTNNQNIVAQLQNQATSYQDAINQLRAAIITLQSQIDANVAEQTRLQAEIVNAEAELAKQKLLLGGTIKQMYLEGQISTLEMLASSKDLSDFVDKQQYRNTVQDKIKSALEKITELKHQLNAQKEQVENLLAQQKSQQESLQASRTEQDNLLAYNQSQQADYNTKTKDNQSKINALIAEQRRANDRTDGGFYFLRFPGSINDFNPDYYPYSGAGFSMQLGPCSDFDAWPDSPDDWGYCTRQCVSFAAWAVQASGRIAPRYYGNAADWVDNARIWGVPVYRTPQPGDIAISTQGTWGHAMYVKDVNGSQFHVWEYNQQLNGLLRTDRWINY